MTQLHAVNRGIGVVRPTNDVDIVLHIEAARGVPARTAAALESIGYRLVTGIDPRNQGAHRFTRGASDVDLVSSDQGAPSTSSWRSPPASRPQSACPAHSVPDLESGGLPDRLA